MEHVGDVRPMHRLVIVFPLIALASCATATTAPPRDAVRPVATFTDDSTSGHWPTTDATQTTAAWEREGTQEASAASTALAAVSTPGIAGQWRSGDGAREAWLEAWGCPPDGVLDATATAAGGEWPTVHSFERLMVRPDGGTPTMVDSQLVQCIDALGAYGLDGRFWSPDGRVFYFTEAAYGGPDGLPCGCCPGLMAWNADTGATSGEYIPSPDRQRVARLDAGTLEVGASNLVSMTSYSPPAGARPNGYPIWSPDGKWLAVPDWPNGCGQAPSGALVLRLSDGRWLRQPAPGPKARIIDLGWSEDSRTVTLYSLPEPDWSWDIATDSVEPLPAP